jgi:hypothetical protein
MSWRAQTRHDRGKTRSDHTPMRSPWTIKYLLPGISLIASSTQFLKTTDYQSTRTIIGLAMRVYTRLGPGLLEFARNRISLDVASGHATRLRLHEAQRPTCLRLSRCQAGLLLKVNTPSLEHGIRCRVL